MKIVCIASVLACAAAAIGQTGVRYRLDPVSQATEQFCLAPCACPFHQSVGPLSGVFTLTLVQVGPLFDDYAVGRVDLVADLPIGAPRFTGSGTYRIGGEVAVMQQLQLELSENGEPPVHYDSGLVFGDVQHPFPEIRVTVTSAQFGCRKNILNVAAHPIACYPDCDASGGLNVADFMCFLDSFAAGDPYANCDGSTQVPVLNVADFSCFLNKFAAGCT